MKKLIAFTLALVMCLSLCACGGGSSSLPDEAPLFNWLEVNQAYYSNGYAVKETYEKGTYTFDCFVSDIQEKGFYSYYQAVDGYCSDIFSAFVEMSGDDLMNLKRGERITVVGTIKEINLDKDMMNVEDTFVTISPAKYISNEHEEILEYYVRGVDGDNQKYHCFHSTRGQQIAVYGLSADIANTLKEGDELTIRGKMEYKNYIGSTFIKMYDITVVE